MKIIGITQARYGSTRLPGKILMRIGDKTLLDLHLQRAKCSARLQQVIVATTQEPEAQLIETIALHNNCSVYKGSMRDVLDRYYQAAVAYQPDYVVRITSDCPLTDPQLIDEIVTACVDGGYDYYSNTIDPTYPDGMDVEVFTFAALEQAWREASLSSDREHVTSFIWRHSTAKGGTLFTSGNHVFRQNLSHFRLTVDELSDYTLIHQLVTMTGEDKDWLSYVNVIKDHPELFEINASIKRNQGFMNSVAEDKIVLRNITNFSKSDAYRKHIHELIPGGAHTYSKGDDQFPELAPAAITHGKGAYVWDLDGNQFLDCSMGLTSVVLGHAYEPVLQRVKEELEKGVNFQRPAAIELEMAERFLNLVPQHQMIKFAKNGSIVTTAAVKLARAFTGRKLVAFPYDHPFYSYDDWFIGKTACNLGVPEEISALSVTYKADDLTSLNELFEKYPGQIACVISEPEKNWGIPENYIHDAIALTHQHGALYIADEMITGFKTDFPGSIKKYKAVPDMATWGKGIANGFSFCALTGKKEVMELGGIRRAGHEKLFLISTTHGGETHSIAAALATIDVFEKENVIEHNTNIGRYLNQLCQEIIVSYDLQEYIALAPSDWMPMFIFKDEKKEISAGFRTLVLQEMIRRGVLFQGAFVPSFSHTRQDIMYFAEAFNQAAGVYRQALENGFERFLKGEPAKPVFRKFI